MAGETKENLLLQESEPLYCDKLDSLPLPNPFYSNHVFTDKDLQRKALKIDLWERFWLMFKTTYVQLSGDYVFHYKTMGGRYYFIKEEPAPRLPTELVEADIALYGGARGGGTKGFD